MKYITIIFFFLFLTINCYAQQFDWGFTLGGTNSEVSPHLTKDDNGNVYVVGPLIGTLDMNPSTPVNNLTSSKISMFIAKYDATGKYVWAKSLTTSGTVLAEEIKLNKKGEIFILGHSNGRTDFDPDTGTVLDSGYNLFLLKLDNSGKYIFSKRFRTQVFLAHNDFPPNLNIDNNGDIICSFVHKHKVDLDPGPDSFIVNSSLISSYITKLDSLGNFIWGALLAGNDNTYVYDQAIDDQNNIYFIGAYRSTVNVNLKGGSDLMTSLSLFDAYIVKYDKNGNLLRKFSYGSGLDDRGYAIFIKGKDLYMSGIFNGDAIDFDPSNSVASPGTSTSPSLRTYIVKWDTAFNFKWLKTSTGNANYLYVDYMNVDKRNNISIVGSANGTGVNMSMNGSRAMIPYNNSCVYVCKYDSSGSFRWFRCLNGGTSSTDVIATDAWEDKWNRFSLCGNFTSLVNVNPNNTTYSSSNGYQDLFISTLKSNNVYDTSINFCDSIISPSGKFTWKTSGKYNDTLQNFFGGDSIIRPLITNRTQYINNSLTVCDKYKSPSGKILTQTGTYYDTTSNLYGCKNYYTINLIVKPLSFSNLTASACEKYNSPSGKFLWTNSGIYYDTMTNYLGCDSILTINLTINTRKTANINVTECGTYTSPSGKYTYNYSWNFKDTISTVNGCDSIININLKILPTNKWTIYEKACESYTSPSGKYTWFSSGVYTDTLVNKFGCDSVLNINLTVAKASSSTINIQPCYGETVIVGSKKYSKSGTYRDTLLNANGCDSFVEIQINFMAQIDTKVTKNGRELNSIKGYDNYQWLRCLSNGQFDMLSGRNSDSLRASFPGSYAVEITEGSCKDTSVCTEIFASSISSIMDQSIVIFPNPSHSALSMNSSDEIVDVKFISSDGKSIKMSIIAGQQVEVDTSTLSAGIYTLVINTLDQKTYYYKLFIE